MTLPAAVEDLTSLGWRSPKVPQRAVQELGASHRRLPRSPEVDRAEAREAINRPPAPSGNAAVASGPELPTPSAESVRADLSLFSHP